MPIISRENINAKSIFKIICPSEPEIQLRTNYQNWKMVKSDRDSLSVQISVIKISEKLEKHSKEPRNKNCEKRTWRLRFRGRNKIIAGRVNTRQNKVDTTFPSRLRINMPRSILRGQKKQPFVAIRCTKVAPREHATLLPFLYSYARR